MCVNWTAASASSVARSRAGVSAWWWPEADMKSRALALFPKAQRSGGGWPGRATGVFAQHSEELFGAAALVALEVTDNGDFAGGCGAGEVQVSKGVTVVRQARDFGQNGNPKSHRDKQLQGGDLRAPVADLRHEIVVAKKTVDLRRERARVAHRNEGFRGKIVDADFGAACERVILADHEQQLL